MIDNIIKFFRLNAIIMKNAYIRDSKIPGVVFINVASQFFDIAVSLIFFNVIFLNTNTLAGWNLYQVIFLYALAKFIASFHASWTKRGLKDMTRDLIRLGDYDFFLTKPFDPMIYVSISKPKIYSFLANIFESFLMIYALRHAEVPIGASNIFWFLFLVILSLILYYFLSVITIIPAFWFTRVSAINDMMNRLVQFMKYPAGVFPRILQISLSIFFPIIIVSYLPAKTLFYPPQPIYIIYMILITIIFGVIARRLWLFGQKSYGSASS